jgi:dolichol-phosphate mannosyltransferase
MKLGLNVIVGFSDKPLKLVMIAGFGMALLSFGMTLLILVLHLMGILTVQGWASIALSLWFLAGCLLFALGLTGLYVGRILVETKGRPSYVVDRVLAHANAECPAKRDCPSPTAANSK